MPRRSVTERLRAGEVLLMDGGTGSELQRRGVEVLLGSRGDKLGPWSATANLDAADVVQQVHQDYLRVGADVIISNNFRTTRTRLAPVGLGDRWQEYAEAGGRLAVRARNAINPEAYVAGGMAAPGLGMLNDRPETDVAIMGEQEYRREFAEHSKVLAATGVDVMLPEFVNYIADCVAAVDACAEAGRPVWLGVPMVTTDGHHAKRRDDGGSGAPPCGAIPSRRSSSCAAARRASAPPSRACVRPSTGRSAPIPTSATTRWPRSGVASTSGPTSSRPRPPAPSRLAEFAQEWIEMGAQIVGGCCATGPEHIMAMKVVVDAARRATRRAGRLTIPAMRIVETLPRRVREIENVWIPAGSTGHRMAARLWLPEGAEDRPVPAILTYLPYRKRDSTRAGDDPMHRYFSGHGYACLRVDMRGVRRLRRADGRRVRGAGARRRQGPDRVDRGPALVHRQGRHDRQLLGRVQRAPDRGPPAAGARGDRHQLLDRRPLHGRHALHGRVPPQRLPRLGLVLLRPACPGRPTRRSRAPTGAGSGRRAWSSARLPLAVWLAAPASRPLLEARLGQRGLRGDPVPGLRHRRLDGRLLERHPPAPRAPPGAAARAHRRVGTQVRPPGRPRAGDRLPAGVPPLVRPLAPGPRHRDHARADAARLHAGGGAADAATIRSAPGRWVAEPVWPPRGDPAPAPPSERGRRAPRPRRAAP